MKKLASVLLALVMVVTVCCSVSFAAEGEAAFTGRREVTYTLDNSYLSNYFNGGRAAFDRYLRATKPEWLGVNYLTEGTRIYMTLSFSFDSVEDYTEKVTVLTQTEPTVFYTAGDPDRFVENVSSMQLLNFCKSKIETDAVLETYAFDDIVTFYSGLFFLNGTEYNAAEQLSINNEPLGYAASSINITTTLDKAYRYTRVIQLEVSEAETAEKDLAQLKKHLKKWSDQVEVETVGEMRIYSVTVDAGSYSELEKYTMGILNATDSIQADESYVDDETLAVAFSEVLDLSQILDPDSGQCNYVFEFPASYTVVSLEGEELQSDTVAVGNSDGNISFEYTKPFSMEEITILTDVSDVYGKIKRSVICRIPVKIAPYYHDEIKDSLTESLTDGQTLTIYDSAIYRNYEITYGSWFNRQVRSIGQKQFSESTFALERAKIPYTESRLTESWSSCDLPYSDATGNIRHEIILPKGTLVRVESSTKGTLTDSGYLIENLQRGKEIELVFRDASLHVVIVCALLLVAVFIVALILFLTVRKWIKIIRMRVAEKATKPSGGRRSLKDRFGIRSPESRTCPQCGTKLSVNAKFCGNCGKKVADTEQQSD